MTVSKLNNIFSDDELRVIYKIINETVVPRNEDGSYIDYRKSGNGTGLCEELGRIQLTGLRFPEELNNKILKIINDLSDVTLHMHHIIYAEYSNKYGVPQLPAHFDHDTNDMVFDYQLEANTSWDLGVDLKNYELEDNSALIFNANKHIHWRPEKTFKDGEYVRMLFIRFFNPVSPSDYSNLDYVINHDIFKEVNAFRDTLKS